MKSFKSIQRNYIYTNFLKKANYSYKKFLLLFDNKNFYNEKNNLIYFFNLWQVIIEKLFLLIL